MHRGFRLVALLLLAFSTSAVAQKTAAPPDPYKPVLDRLEAITAMPLTGWQAHQADLAHGEQASADTTGWQPIKVREDWQGPRWLRQNIEIPAALNGYNLQGSRVSLDLHVSSDVDIRVAVFANGNMMARTDEDGQVPIVLTDNAQPGQKFDIAVRVEESGGASCCGGNSTRIYRAQLLIEPPATRPDPATMRLEILSAEPLIAAYPDGKAERQQQLSAAVSAINLDALSRGDQQAFDASLREAQQKLEVLQPYMRQFKVSAVGNSHIDMAWLWPWTETVEVVRNTFGTALELMREYPDFKFTASTAQAYTWIEEKYPDMFKEIQQRVKEGRWEVIGGMWVEPDLNMPDGESLVRQILYGKRYFRDKFGVDIHIGWNPDSFGYNWQLPQIYKRSGIDSFVTQKLLWASDFYKFPYRLFWWQSPDGSRMLTYFPSDYANAIDPDKIARDSAAYGPMMWKYNGGTNSAPAGSLDMMYLYGVGDHGGGPTRQDLDTALRWQKHDVVFPSLQFSTAADFIADLDKNQANLNLPVWNNELYFQYHRGVFTTQSEEKRGNRQNEELILNAEKLAAIDSLYGAAYPAKNFDDSWKKILFNQFHDILPGSGIGINYVDAARKYEVTSRLSNDTIQAALNDLAARVVSDGVNVLVFNPLSWARTGEVEAEVQFPLGAKDVSAVDFEGKPIPVVVLNNDWQTGRVRVRLLAKNIPPTGYKLIQLLPRAASVAPKTTLLATDTTLENEFVRVTVDPATGCITSLYDKRGEVEALALPKASTGSPHATPDGKPCGNLLQAFVDKPQRWDAWNVDADFVNQYSELIHADEVKLVENTPLRAVIRVKHHFQKSSFVQDITVYPGVPRVDVHMSADWHEQHILLKVAFPVRAESEKATFEIPYGSIERPTTRRTPEEQAQFEVPALRWADISDAIHGFSLLNDSKYGYDAKDNVLRLSLLRGPTWPDPNADQGHHEFTYALYPHAGTWREAMTVRQGYELNYPLLAVGTGPHHGSLMPGKSFFGTDEDNVVITAIKQAADDDGIVVRFYEWAGKKGDIHLRLPQAANSAEQTNLMESPQGPLTLAEDGMSVTVPTGAYEIKTVKLKFVGR